jgi:hypothetical protein
MNIERLNRAATAAGFAMATPDDEIFEAPVEAEAEVAQSRAVAVAESAPARVYGTEAIAGATRWVRSLLPASGRRATA